MRIFYVYYEHRGWDVNTVGRYLQGECHDSWFSATTYCESVRRQGRKFHIHELPALAMVAGHRALMVTQLYTDDVLQNVNVAVFQSLAELVPFPSLSLRQLGYAFRANSPVWPTSYDALERVRALYCADTKDLKDIDESDQMDKASSNSDGAALPLSWGTSNARVSARSVVAIKSNLSGYLLTR